MHTRGEAEAGQAAENNDSHCSLPFWLPSLLITPSCSSNSQSQQTATLFQMPSTSLALTPGLASFLKSLKTNPIDTSIENLISCAPRGCQLAPAKQVR